MKDCQTLRTPKGTQNVNASAPDGHTPDQTPGDSAARRKSANPRYARIADDLCAKIFDGTYLPGALLPSRNEICDLYTVSAITARDALALLTAQGYARAIRGRGHIVRRPRTLLDIPVHIYGPETRTIATGLPATLDHAEVYTDPLPDNIALRLDLDPDTPVWVRHALYKSTHDGQPTHVHVSWLPGITPEQAQELRDTDYPDWPTAIHRVTGHAFATVEQRTRPRLVKPWEAEALGLDDTAVVLVIHATAYDHTGAPIEHTRVTWPRTVARITTTFTYQPPDEDTNAAP